MGPSRLVKSVLGFGRFQKHGKERKTRHASLAWLFRVRYFPSQLTFHRKITPSAFTR